MTTENEVSIAIGDFTTITIDDERIKGLGSADLIKAFRTGIQWIDEDGYDAFNCGVRDWKPQDHRLYPGLLWIKEQLDKEDVWITSNKPYEDMNGDEKFVSSLLDPMKNGWVQELINKDSSED